MYRSRRLRVMVSMGAALLVSTACSSSKVNAKAGIEVDFVNANVGALTLLDSPLGKAAKLPGCEAHKCSPTPGSPSGSVVGWTETRRLPHVYRLSLHGAPLKCPAATGPPAGWTGPYAVVYQITVAGRCVVAQNSPL